jgi:hypothetical protein
MHLYAALALAVIAAAVIGYFYWRFYHPKGE